MLVYKASSNQLQKFNGSVYCKKVENFLQFCNAKVCCRQCNQIGRFIALWVTFQSLRQQLFCPNRPHFQAIYHFSSEILGNFYRHLATFYWSHWLQVTADSRLCVNGPLLERRQIWQKLFCIIDPRGVIDAFTWHHYYMAGADAGPQDFVNPK